MVFREKLRTSFLAILFGAVLLVLVRVILATATNQTKQTSQSALPTPFSYQSSVISQ